MPGPLAATSQVAILLILLGLAFVPLGDHMARVYTSPKDSRVEKAMYTLLRVDPATSQTPMGYLRAVLGFSAASLAILFLIQVCQGFLPALGTRFPGVEPAMAFNTAASFVTNTNWQSYSGESTLTNFTQMTGLTVQNFVSAAVGMAVFAALTRAIGHLAFRGGEVGVGNFWVDLFRGTFRILLPIAAVIATLLILLGTMQSLGQHVTTIFGVEVPRAPVASQEAIKLLGTNGGGIFGANSAHPFESPNSVTNVLEIASLLLISVCLPRTYGTMLGRHRDGLTLLGVMAGLWGTMLGLVTWAQTATGSMEGIEQRFGLPASTLFAVSTTGTSTGAVNSMHDSYSPLGGGLLIVNMLLGEVAPGGVGTGMYGLLMMSMFAVFIGGLLVGRGPEFVGNRIRAKEITAISLSMLVMPTCVLVGVGVSMILPHTEDALNNPGAHGLSEVLYAFTSASNNNGSAFGGLTVTSTWYQLALGFAMLFGRFLPIACTLWLCQHLLAGRKVPASVGTLPTHGATFGFLTAGVVVLVSALTFFPVLALGPILEALA